MKDKFFYQYRFTDFYQKQKTILFQLETESFVKSTNLQSDITGRKKNFIVTKY